MHSHHARRVLTVLLTVLTFCLTTAPAWGQHGSEGRVNVTVVDPQGAVIPAADLTLTDLGTNDVRKAQTTGSGTYSFINLDIGTYRLSVGRAGFAQQTLDNVIVQATKSTDITVTMAVGAQAQTVQVEAVAPVLETTTNQIGTVIDPKQVETLPITGRDLTQLSRLSPGFVGTSATNGVWNGLPTYAQGNNIDGVVGSPARMKFGGNAAPAASPRLENIEEMAVSTDGMDMNQGFGQSAMQVGFITRRGTNAWHGQAYEDFRSSALNANSWFNDARGAAKPKNHRNEFGGTLGGPILRDKLFFFVSLSALRIPGASSTSKNFLNASAEAGNYTYTGTDGKVHTVNLLQTAQAFNASLPSTVNSIIAAQFTRINTAVGSGIVNSTTSPNVNSVTYQWNNPTQDLFPTMRLDYNPVRNIRMNFAANRSEVSTPTSGAPFFPGSDFAKSSAGFKSDNATVTYGLDWTISPTLVNQFKAGWLYNFTANPQTLDTGYTANPQIVNFPQIDSLNLQTPLTWVLPVRNTYPNFIFSDTLAWQHGAHNMSFGWSFIRENDRYWNPPEGIANITTGLVQGDPALDALTNSGAYTPLPGANSTQQAQAQALYALLAGRVSNLFGRWTYDTSSGNYQHKVTAYNLYEVAQANGLFAQDSWRFRPNLTLNFGLRWDFTGDDHDITGAYHNSDESSILGPTTPGKLFTPGALGGNNNPTIDLRPHAYNAWKVSPQPSFGFAWSPQYESGILGKLVGKDATVLRGGFSVRRFTIPYQYFWDDASDYGSFFYQFFSLNANSTPAAGNFTPGTLALGQAFPATSLTPPAYTNSQPMSALTFVGSPNVNNGLANGMKQNISQPYTESWNLGIQRRLGNSRVLEVRYNGNRTIHQWVSINQNEVNIFENGFLSEFKNAQANLNVCLATPSCAASPSFANLGLPGQVSLPIITAAFTGSTGGSQANGQFKSSTWVGTTGFLRTGQAGAMASRLANNGAAPFFCNMVGSAAFSPCLKNSGLNLPGAGFPINFWVANPYALQGTTASGTGFMTDAGYGSYNALQVDFRQQQWHGVQFDANYTWSKTLGVMAGGSGNDWQGNFSQFTLRNLRDSYQPAAFDVHHVFHANATADLPFGKGKAFANSNGVLDKVVGGWNVGTIVSFQSGFPSTLLGGFQTFNNLADSGVNLLNGLTRSQLQSAVGIHKVFGASTKTPSIVTLIDPKYLNLNGTTPNAANTNYFVANTTPGTFNSPLVIYGPHGFFDDMMVTKNVPLTERFRFNIQAAFLNVFNHPVFGMGTSPISTSNIRSTSWGTTTGASTSNGIGARQIELRGNITF